MTMQFTMGTGGIPAGNYVGQFAGAEPYRENVERFGEGVLLKWRVIGGDHDGEETSRICSAKTSSTSNAPALLDEKRSPSPSGRDSRGRGSYLMVIKRHTLDMDILDEIMDEAQFYASIGLRLVVLHGLQDIDGQISCTCRRKERCESKGKHPRFNGWPELATSDSEDIRRQLAEYPGSNIGLLLGPTSGIVDVEYDSEEGEATAKRLLPDHRQTPTYESHRSVHRLYRFPHELAIVQAFDTIQGLELRFGSDLRGAQSVLPPSLHASGKRYRWRVGLSPRDVEPAAFPGPLVELMQRQSEPTNGDGALTFTMSGDLVTAIGAAKGHRHKTLCQLVGSHLATHRPNADLLQLALAWGQRCQPPLAAEEVTKTVTRLTEKELNKRSQNATPPDQALVLRPLSQVIAKPVRFIWGHRIAFGKLNIIAGDGGDGKTTVACDLASRLSRGKALPGDADGQRMASLIITAEDGDGDTVRHRIESMGGDLDFVFVPGDMFDSFRSDTAALRAAVSRQRDLKVIFFDTLPDYIGETTDDHKNSSVRQALKPIIAMAGKLEVAIVGICHFRKGGDGKSGDRLLGSVAYRNLPRSVLYVLKDPDNEAQRILWHEKHNLSPQAPTLSFSMQPRGDAISIAWNADPIYIDDIGRYLKAKPRRSTKADEARAWLRTVLPPGTAKPRDEIIAAAQAAGFHEKTLYRVADAIAKDKTTGLWSNNQNKEIDHPILKLSPGNSQDSPGTEN